MIGRILLVVLGALVAAFIIPVRIRVEHLDAWRVRIWLFGAVPVWSFSSSDKSKTTPKKKRVSAKMKPTDKPSVKEELQSLFREEGVVGVMSFFSKLVQLLTTTLSSLARYITIRRLALCVRVGGREADDTATLYGKLSASMAAGLAVLSRCIRVRRPCVRVLPDFTAEDIDVRLRMTLWVCPFGIIGVVVAAAWRFIRLWIKTIGLPRNGGNDTVRQPVSK